MSAAERIKDNGRQVLGYLRFKVGGATGNRRAQATGTGNMVHGKGSEVTRGARDRVRKNACGAG